MRLGPRIAGPRRKALGAALALCAGAALAAPPADAPGPTASLPLEALAASAEATPAARIEAVRALQADPARDALGKLVRLLAAPLPPEVRAAAVDALVARSGRDDLGPNAEAWAAWWKEVSFLPEGDWRLRLAEAQSARAGRLQAQRDAAIRRLGETLPRLHALTPPEERSDLIAGLMRDEIPDVARMGIDLASRALLNAQPLGETVQEAAYQALARPSPEVRAGAARLLERLAPKGASARAGAALQSETDERAAQALLRLAGLEPDEAAAGPALVWLSRKGGARDAAADLLASLASSGSLNVRDRQRSLAALRALGPDSWTPSLVRLLGAVGEADADLTLLVELATMTTGAPQDAAMESLVATDAGLAMAEAAATAHPSLVDPFARAVSVRRPSAAGFWAVMRCSGAERLSRPSIALALRALEPNDVEGASMLFTDPRERDAFLSLWLAQHAQPGPNAEHARLWLHAARARLAMRDGPGALEALDRAGAAAPESRAEALLYAGCPEAAAQHSRDPELWLRALEGWGDRPGARAAAEGFLGMLGCPASEDQAARLCRVLADGARRAPAGSP